MSVTYLQSARGRICRPQAAFSPDPEGARLVAICADNNHTCVALPLLSRCQHLMIVPLHTAACACVFVRLHASSP